MPVRRARRAHSQRSRPLWVALQQGPLYTMRPATRHAALDHRALRKILRAELSRLVFAVGRCGQHDDPERARARPERTVDRRVRRKRVAHLWRRSCRATDDRRDRRRRRLESGALVGMLDQSWYTTPTNASLRWAGLHSASICARVFLKKRCPRRRKVTAFCCRTCSSTCPIHWLPCRRCGSSVPPTSLVLIEVPGIFRLHKTALDPMRYWQNAHTFTFCAQTLLATCRRAGYEPLQVDESIHLVLQGRSAAALGTVRTDPKLAVSIERYLRYCELSHRLATSCAAVPFIGALAGRVVRRAADALMRAMQALGLIAGMRAHA